MSISDELAAKNNFHSSKLNAGGGVSGGKLKKTQSNLQGGQQKIAGGG